jgi:hypothetical protein
MLWVQITIGIGNEVRESTVQLSQMVRASRTFALFVSFYCRCGVERRVRRDVGHPQGHLPANEQHGGAPRMSMALVHRLSRPRILVLHRGMVVSTVSSGHCTLALTEERPFRNQGKKCLRDYPVYPTTCHSAGKLLYLFVRCFRILSIHATIMIFVHLTSPGHIYSIQCLRVTPNSCRNQCSERSFFLSFSFFLPSPGAGPVCRYTEKDTDTNDSRIQVRYRRRARPDHDQGRKTEYVQNKDRAER